MSSRQQVRKPTPRHRHSSYQCSENRTNLNYRTTLKPCATEGGGTSSWLEDLLQRYREIGDVAGTARVEEAIRQRAGDARSEMKSHSITVDVPRKEFDQFAVQICGDSLDQALARVVSAGLMKYDSMVSQVRKALEGAPLVSMITMSLTGPEGFTEAKVGGIDEDEEGRAVHHAGQMMSMHGGMLDILFDRILKKYSPTAAQLADFTNCVRSTSQIADHC